MLVTLTASFGQVLIRVFIAYASGIVFEIFNVHVNHFIVWLLTK